MKTLFYYILAAIGGGVVAEINKKHDKAPTVKEVFVIGFTSVMIGIVVGFLVEYVTHNVRLTIAITALVSVGGYANFEWLAKLIKEKIEKSLK